ncbi:MAG: complex I subunit 5 family protein [Candidatus Hodarchaeota archaeon]
MSILLMELTGRIILILPICAAIIVLPISLISRRLTAIWSSFIIFIMLACISLLMTSFDTPFQLVFPFYSLPLVFNFHAIALFVSFIPIFLGSLSMIYSYSYQINQIRWHYFFSLLFIASMVLLVLSENLIWIFIFMEATTITSAILVSLGRRPEAKEATMKYLIITIFTSVFTILGIFIIKNVTGTLILSEINWDQITSLFEMKVAISLIFIGLSTKAAAFPFHFWLPDAHSEAPVTTSVLLSGGKIIVAEYSVFMILYKVINSMTSVFSSASFLDIGFILSSVGILTMVIGNVMALAQNDLKRMLAYCNVSQIGYILIGFSLGTAFGLAAALYHMFTHSISKGLLFLGAGSVEHSTGARDIDKLGSIAAGMPLTTISMVVGSLSISGIPPFGGYTSKRLLYEAFFEAHHPEYAIVAILVSALTLVLFLKLLSSVFFGINPNLDLPPIDEIHESPKSMIIPMIILTVCCLIVGVIPDFIINTFINPGITVFLPGEKLAISAWPNILIQETVSGVYSPISVTILILIGLIFGLFLYRVSGRKPTIRESPSYETITEAPSANLPFTGGFYNPPYLSLGQIYVPSSPFEFASKPILNLFKVLHSGRLTSYLWYITAGALIILTAIVLLA